MAKEKSWRIVMKYYSNKDINIQMLMQYIIVKYDEVECKQLPMRCRYVNALLEIALKAGLPTALL